MVAQHALRKPGGDRADIPEAGAIPPRVVGHRRPAIAIRGRRQSHRPRHVRRLVPSDAGAWPGASVAHYKRVPCIDGALRTVQHRLNEMFCVGWPRRCEISTGKRRHTQRVYQLGHELILAHRGRTELARPVEPAGKWRPPEVLTRTELAQAPITSRHRASPRLLRGADGIRTHDLLHGKQNVRSRASHESHGKERFPHQPARSRRTIGTMARPSLFARRSGRTAANGASTSARTMRGPRAPRST